MVPKRYANCVDKSTTLHAWRGNQNQQRQHAAVVARLRLRYSKKWKNPNCKIKLPYNANEIRQNPTKLQKWADEKIYKEANDTTSKKNEKLDINSKWNETISELMNTCIDLYPVEDVKVLPPNAHVDNPNLSEEQNKQNKKIYDEK